MLLNWLITHTSTDVRSLIAGGVAGCVAKTFTAPLDRVKILFQGNNPNLHRFMTEWTGPMQAVWWIYRQDGLLACYKGHAATLARIFPYAALNYYCYERYKRAVMSYLQRHHIERISEQAVVSVVAGSMAGTTSVLFTYPLDYVHSRITYQVKIARYRGIWQTIRSTMQEGVEQAKAERMSVLHSATDATTAASSSSSTTVRPSDARLPLPHFLYGLRKLYTGFGTTVLGIIPYAGVSFATYDSLKKFTKRYYPDSEPPVAIRLLWGRGCRRRCTDVQLPIGRGEAAHAAVRAVEYTAALSQHVGRHADDCAERGSERAVRRPVHQLHQSGAGTCHQLFHVRLCEEGAGGQRRHSTA